MRTPVWSAVFLIVCCSAFSADFRSVSWMMTRDQVVDAERGAIVSERALSGQREILYQTTLNGYAGSLSYTLEDDRLVAAAYNFPGDYRAELFGSLKETLTRLYGPPSFQSDRLVGWRMNRTEVALAFVSGRVCHLSYWEKSYFARINDLSSPPRP